MNDGLSRAAAQVAPRDTLILAPVTVTHSWTIDMHVSEILRGRADGSVCDDMASAQAPGSI
jgi:hypothetical protein